MFSGKVYQSINQRQRGNSKNTLGCLKSRPFDCMMCHARHAIKGLDFFCFIPRLMLPPKHLISDTPTIVGASEIRWKNHNHVYRKIVTNEYNQIMDVKNLDNSGTKQQTLDNTC